MSAANRSKEPKNMPPTRGTKIINPGAEPSKDIPYQSHRTRVMKLSQRLIR